MAIRQSTYNPHGRSWDSAEAASSTARRCCSNLWRLSGDHWQLAVWLFMPWGGHPQDSHLQQRAVWPEDAKVIQRYLIVPPHATTPLVLQVENGIRERDEVGALWVRLFGAAEQVEAQRGGCMRDAKDGKPMLRHEAMRLQNMFRRALSAVIGGNPCGNPRRSGGTRVWHQWQCSVAQAHSSVPLTWSSVSSCPEMNASSGSSCRLGSASSFIMNRRYAQDASVFWLSACAPRMASARSSSHVPRTSREGNCFPLARGRRAS